MMLEKFHTRFDPNENYSNFDHILIGSGIGSLTAATWLAKGGYKVLLLEQHYKPGGFTHTFKRKNGYKWDVGVHYIGNVGEKGPLKPMFDFLTNGELEWESMGDVYDVAHIGEDSYNFVTGKEEQIKNLIQYFPEEEEAIRSYFQLVEKANKWARAFFFEKTFKPILSIPIGWIIRKLFYRFSNKTTDEVLRSITKNKRLRAVLCAQCGNYGLPPKESSFAAHALVIGHFLHGGFYPKGGAEMISSKILKVLDSLGAKIVVKAKVQEIVVKNNQVQGVKVAGVFIPCKSVISGVGVNNTDKMLLNNSTLTIPKLKKIKPSTGHLCLYLGLNKSDKELQLPKHNVWSFEKEDLDACLRETTIETAASKFSYISFPSSKDSLWQKEQPNKAVIQALSIGKYEWFEKYKDLKTMKRGAEYEVLKKKFEVVMLARIIKLFPQIKDHIQLVEVSTPLSTVHYSNYENGEIYGLEHTPERFATDIRFETKIKGLRQCGQDITLVGVAGAMSSGMLCSTTILKFKVRHLFKEMANQKY